MVVDLKEFKKKEYFEKNNMKPDSYIKDIPSHLAKNDNYNFEAKE